MSKKPHGLQNRTHPAGRREPLGAARARRVGRTVGARGAPVAVPATARARLERAVAEQTETAARRIARRAETAEWNPPGDVPPPASPPEWAPDTPQTPPQPDELPIIDPEEIPGDEPEELPGVD